MHVIYKKNYDLQNIINKCTQFCFAKLVHEVQYWTRVKIYFIPYIYFSFRFSFAEAKLITLGLGARKIHFLPFAFSSHAPSFACKTSTRSLVPAVRKNSFYTVCVFLSRLKFCASKICSLVFSLFLIYFLKVGLLRCRGRLLWRSLRNGVRLSCRSL